VSQVESAHPVQSQQLTRILGSTTLKNAESLRRLLAYLGEQTLAGRAEALKEYTVGVEAFAKPPDYDPKTDSSVRVLLSNLRKKLDDYYRGEGADDPVLIELPKGGFRLLFRERTGGGKPHPTTPDQAALRRWRLATMVLAFLLTATLAAALIGHSGSFTGQAVPEIWTQEHWGAACETFWRPYLDGSRPVLIAFGTPMFVRFPRGFFRNPQVNDWQTAQAEGLPKELELKFGGGPAAPAYIYTGVGEAIGAFNLALAFSARHREVSVRGSSEVGWEAIERNDLIYLGPEKFIPRIFELPANRDLIIRDAGIRNLHPKPGEPASYIEGNAVVQSDGTTMRDGHALISRVRGLHGRGYITMLAATSTEGTRAAVEYVTRKQYAQELVSKIQVAPGVLPSEFQVVLKVRYRALVPVDISYVTHHVLLARAASTQR